MFVKVTVSKYSTNMRYWAQALEMTIYRGSYHKV